VQEVIEGMTDAWNTAHKAPEPDVYDEDIPF